MNIKWFGAVGDASVGGGTVSGTDDTAAFAALNTFCHIDNGTGYGGGRACFVPTGSYYIASTVTFDAPVRLFGEEGGGTFEYNRSSRIVSPAGKTAFKLVRGSTLYADNAFITDLSFQAAARNETATTGSMENDSRSLTLASAADFADGDVVIVRGAGYSGRFREGVTASTTNGSAVVTLSDSGPTGAYPGMVLSMAGAGFPTDAHVLSVTSGQITMSGNAAASVSGAAMTVYGDLVGYIAAGGGTTTVQLNAYAHRAVTGVEVRHGDCGIYALTGVNVERVEFTGYQIGAAVTAGGNFTQPSGQATNANCMAWNKIVVHGNRIRLIVAGTDANACTFASCYAFENLEYCFVDQSFLGNLWRGSHTSNGLGILHVLFVSRSLFDFCYSEGGTANSFGANVTGMGIQPGIQDGRARVMTNSGYLGMPRHTLYPWGSESTTLQVYVGEVDLGRVSSTSIIVAREAPQTSSCLTTKPILFASTTISLLNCHSPSRIAITR